jgi:hypothetical protein
VVFFQNYGKKYLNPEKKRQKANNQAQVKSLQDDTGI